MPIFKVSVLLTQPFTIKKERPTTLTLHHQSMLIHAFFIITSLCTNLSQFPQSSTKAINLLLLLAFSLTGAPGTS